MPGPSDTTKIAIGVVAAVGVVFVSYTFFRIFGTKQGECSSLRRKRSKARKQQSKTETSDTTKVPADKISDAQTSVKQDEAQQLPPEDLIEIADLKAEASTFDNPNQTSFIVVDKASIGPLPDDDVGEGERSSKKSDRSSDESSFDVVEAGGEEDEEDKKPEAEEGAFFGVEGTIQGDNESSMVIVDSDANGMETSSSSVYQSADETLSKYNREGKQDGTFKRLESPKSERKEEDLSESISVTDSETTVMYTADSRLQGRGEGSEVSDLSKTADDVTLKDTSFGTGDESGTSRAKTPQPEASKEAGQNIPKTSVTPATSTTSIDSETRSHKILTASETARTLTMCQNSASTVSKSDVSNLVELLRANSRSLRPAVLDCIVRVSVFSHNNNYLCQAGCGWVLAQHVQEVCSAIVQGEIIEQTALEDLSGALTNLSLNPMFQSQLEGSVSPLIDVLLLDPLKESVQMSTLRPLTNLSSEATFHHIYKRGIHRLFTLLDIGSEPVRLQCLKVLVNLSLNPDMVPYQLSAKAPSTLLDLVDDSSSEDLVLRMVSMLGNIFATISSARLSQSSLPTTEKVESPYTLYTALCGVAEMPHLRNKVYRLTRHDNRDISQQASKLYHFVTETRK